MTIVNTLNTLRRRFDGVSTLAFVDLSTQMVLCTSSDDAPDQEYLDALCATAVEMLAGEVAAQMSPVIAPESAAPIQHAIIMQDSDIAVFVRSALCLDDAICAVCAPTIDVPRLIPDLSAELDQLLCAQAAPPGQ